MKIMKIRPVAAELLHAFGRTDRHDEDNGRNFANVPKNCILKIWKGETTWEIESWMRKQY